MITTPKKNVTGGNREIKMASQSLAPSQMNLRFSPTNFYTKLCSLTILKPSTHKNKYDSPFYKNNKRLQRL